MSTETANSTGSEIIDSAAQQMLLDRTGADTLEGALGELIEQSEEDRAALLKEIRDSLMEDYPERDIDKSLMRLGMKVSQKDFMKNVKEKKEGLLQKIWNNKGKILVVAALIYFWPNIRKGVSEIFETQAYAREGENRKVAQSGRATDQPGTVGGKGSSSSSAPNRPQPGDAPPSTESEGSKKGNDSFKKDKMGQRPETSA